MAEELKIVPENEERRSIFGSPRSAASGFLEFIRERGVMGLAIGFVLGSAVQKVVTAFVTDIVNPFVGIFLGRTDGLKNFAIGQFMIGDFITVMIDFLILAAVIYFVFKALRLDKLDKLKI